MRTKEAENAGAVPKDSYDSMTIAKSDKNGQRLICAKSSHTQSRMSDTWQVETRCTILPERRGYNVARRETAIRSSSTNNITLL